MGPRATARGPAQSEPGGGDASQPPGPTAGSHRQRPSRHRGGPAAAPGAAYWHPHPHGAHAHRHRHPRGHSQPGEKERTLSRRIPAAPHPAPRPSHARGPRPHPLTRSGLRGHCSARGRHRPAEAGGRHPREARPARAQAGEGNTGGHTRGMRTGEGRGGRQRRGGAGKHARRGPWDRDAGTAWGPEVKHRERGRAPRKTSAGSHRHPHTRAVPRRLGRRPVLAIPGAGPTTRPHRRSRRATHPSSAIHPRQIRLPSKSDPEARHPGDNALEPGGPGRDRTPPPPAAQGRGRARQAPPHRKLRGWGSRGPTGHRAPTLPPSPRAHTTGGWPRAHGPPPACRDARRGPAGPSPDSEGGGAGRSRQRAAHSPTAGPAHPTPSPPTGGGGVLPTCSGSRPQRPLHTREGQRLGGPVPQGSLSDR